MKMGKQMTILRKKHNVQFKMKVAIEAIKQQKTMTEITARYGIHATQINRWKKQALDIIPDAFSLKQHNSAVDQEALTDELYKQIGQLTVERDWLKKNHEFLNIR